MLQVLLVIFFLHQSQGYGVKVQAKVDIGDDGLAIAVKELMDKYLQNGQAEIDISELVQRFQMLASTQTPQQMILVTKRNDETKKAFTNDHNLMKINKQIDNNEANKPKVENAKTKHTNKEKNNFDEFSDDDKEKIDKKTHKSKKKNEKSESDDFSDESKELKKKSHKSHKRHGKHVSDESTDENKEEHDSKHHKSNKTKKESESDEFSDDSKEKNDNKNKETTQTSENHKIKPSKKNHSNDDGSKEKEIFKPASRDNEAEKNEKSKLVKIDNNNVNKLKSKNKETAVGDISSGEFKAMREKIHIFGLHEGVQEVKTSKYPINNIRV